MISNDIYTMECNLSVGFVHNWGYNPLTNWDEQSSSGLLSLRSVYLGGLTSRNWGVWQTLVDVQEDMRPAV